MPTKAYINLQPYTDLHKPTLAYTGLHKPTQLYISLLKPAQT